MLQFTKEQLTNILQDWIKDDTQLEYMVQGALWMQLNRGCDVCRQMQLDTTSHCLNYSIKATKEMVIEDAVEVFENWLSENGCDGKSWSDHSEDFRKALMNKLKLNT